jgi:hypothetical protein
MQTDVGEIGTASGRLFRSTCVLPLLFPRQRLGAGHLIEIFADPQAALRRICFT